MSNDSSVSVGFVSKDGRLILLFGQPVDHMSFSPAEARRFAEKMLNGANVVGENEDKIKAALADLANMDKKQ